MLDSFSAYGHSNITATHKTTVEFTKDRDLSLRGNCILGVNADFDLEKIKNFIKGRKKIKIIIKVNGISEEIIADVNPDFDDDKEIVIRMGGFKSRRTLAARADKAAIHLKRDLVEKLKNPEQIIKILIANP